MKISSDRASALVFLAAAVAYLLLAREIELYPGDEEEFITARTFPKVIGAMAAVFSFLILILPAKGAAAKLDWSALDWRRPVLLCLLMVVYGLTIKWPGFLPATSFFLMASFLVLGERRWWVLLGASLAVAAGFELVLDGLLDIYIQDPFLEWIGVKGS